MTFSWPGFWIGVAVGVFLIVVFREKIEALADVVSDAIARIVRRK